MPLRDLRAPSQCWLFICVLPFGHRGPHVDRFGGRTGRPTRSQKRKRREHLATLPVIEVAR